MCKVNMISKALTWDQLANAYKKATGNSAKIRPMDDIFDWAKNQKSKYYVHPKEGTLHKIIDQS